ncbi:MAG: helix-turn-helix domain-containing protein [Lachnospiraceae bacterium]|nr:helix-turn-helix domain-containing protein [Lachnospiraceae bacterium]
MNFAEKIRQLRKEKRMSQIELAQAIGVTSRTIQFYESGKSFPRYRETYRKLAEILSCDVNDLLIAGSEAADNQEYSQEEAVFISEAAAQYGSRGKRQAEKLIEEVSGCFAGGELSEEDKDEMMKAIQDAYWMAKKNNQKYAPKKQ